MDHAAVAQRIAQHVVDLAFRDGDECTWLGRTQFGGGPLTPASYLVQSMGADLYGGASGVALFLARCGALAGDALVRETAQAAARFAVRRAAAMPPLFRRALYTGRLGAAWAAVQVARATNAPDLEALARTVLDALAADVAQDGPLDVISGDAGAIGPWLQLSALLDEPRYRDAALAGARRLVARAAQVDGTWQWGEDAVGFPIVAPLTGYAHGASGMAVALLEAAREATAPTADAASGPAAHANTHSGADAPPDPGFVAAAEGALAYEAQRFDASVGNWPDLRFSPERGGPPSFGNAWCVGAPGVALGRVRAVELRPHDEALRRDLRVGTAAIHAYAARVPALGDTDFSLCHGWAGLGDILLETRRVAPEPATDALIERIATEGAERHGENPAGWCCGLREGSTPGLMLGLAGIGYFFLRLAAPQVPSVLLVRPAPEI